MKTMRKPKTPRVLVAEDNPVSRQMTIRLLAKMGVEADMAEDGFQAVAKARSGAYDLILMDVRMPVMGGLEATRELRRSGVDTPIVAMTASAENRDREQCLDSGMTDYLAKPLNLETLKQLLAVSCGSVSAREPHAALLQPVTGDKTAVPSHDAAQQKIAAADEFVHAERFLERSAKALDLAAEDYSELAAEFIGDVEQRLNALEAALIDCDHERVRQIAHAIKGGSADMLLEDMASVAARIEFSAKERELTGCGAELNLLRSMLERFQGNVV